MVVLQSEVGNIEYFKSILKHKICTMSSELLIYSIIIRTNKYILSISRLMHLKIYIAT